MRLENDYSVRAVIVRGAGGHFRAGGDIRERRAQTEDSRPGGPAMLAKPLTHHLFRR